MDEEWLEELTDSDKAALEAGLAAIEKDPNGGSSWDEVKARIQAKLDKIRDSRVESNTNA